jgi:putative ABC transport system permease protein
LLGYLFVQGSGAGGFEIDFYYPRLPALAALFSGLARKGIGRGRPVRMMRTPRDPGRRK